MLGICIIKKWKGGSKRERKLTFNDFSRLFDFYEYLHQTVCFSTDFIIEIIDIKGEEDGGDELRLFNTSF
jgi:hypothetical protein